MNNQEIQQLWDEYRDGGLSSEQRAAFEQALAADPKLQAMWDAESQWLDAMSHADAADADHDRAFVGSVVDQWASETEQPVIARIGWRRVWTAVATTAAAAAIIFAVWVGSQQHEPIRPGPTIAQVPDNAGATPVDPVSALMRDMDEQVAQQPQRIRDAVTNTASLFSMKQVFNLIQVDVPDPAKYLEPSEKKS